MSKKDFIALADAIKAHNENELQYAQNGEQTEFFSTAILQTLAEFCDNQNPNFKRDRWLAYIAGECGPNGGSVK